MEYKALYSPRRKKLQKKTIIITVDLEDWFQVENFSNYIQFSQWESKEWRFERNTHDLLDIFSEYQIKATFFIVGWNAERSKHLVQEIHKRGHEVASHGYYHQLCTEISLGDLREDLKKSKAIIEDIISTEIMGFRAPCFSINNQVLVFLKEVGYIYDSSYNTFGFNSRYGRLDLTNFIHTGIAYKDPENFYELPVSNMKIGNIIVPWSGGGYFRLFPKRIFIAGVKRILQKENVYLFYIHPWEIDPDQPRLAEANSLLRLRHYINIKTNKSRLSNFLKTFQDCSFITCQQYIKSLS